MKKMRIEALPNGKGMSFWTFPDPETAFCFIEGGSNSYLPMMSRFRLHPNQFVEIEFCGYEVGTLENGTDQVFTNVRIIEPIEDSVKFNGKYMLDQEFVAWVSPQELSFTNESNENYVKTLINDDESKIDVEGWVPNEMEAMALGTILNTC